MNHRLHPYLLLNNGGHFSLLPASISWYQYFSHVLYLNVIHDIWCQWGSFFVNILFGFNQLKTNHEGLKLWSYILVIVCHSITISADTPISKLQATLNKQLHEFPQSTVWNITTNPSSLFYSLPVSCIHLTVFILSHSKMTKWVIYHCALHYMTHEVKSEPVNLKKKSHNMVKDKLDNQFIEPHWIILF